tara:strand:+ start:13275 stop:16088 length:2814 start_codon:yes stop_codon:yes gene_type:complete
MPKLYDRQANEWRDIADHLVEDAYKSGRFLFKKGAEVNVQLPDGRYGTVPAEHLDDVLQAGGTYDLAADRQERIEQAEYGEDRDLEALLLAAGRGLTFGLSDVAAEKFGDYSEEELRKLEEYNPTISAVGEIGGAVLPAFFTGGTSTAAQILSKGTLAGQAARAGVATEKAVAGAIGLDKATFVADKMLKGGASLGAAAGIEGVLFGAGETISEELLGRTDRTAEQMLANIGSVGLLSGGIGTALGAGPGALTKAFQAFHGNRFSKGLGDKVAQFSDDLTAAMTSGDRATIAKFRDPEFLDRYIGFDDIRKKTHADTRSFINSFQDDFEQATKMAAGSTKAEEMLDLVNAVNPVQTLNSSANVIASLKGRLEEMVENTADYAQNAGPLLKAVNDRIDSMATLIQKGLKKNGQLPEGGKVVFENGSFLVRSKDTGWGVTRGRTQEVPLDQIPTDWGNIPAHVFNLVDDFKKVVGSSLGKNRALDKVGFNTDAAFGDIYTSLRKHLEDEALFGPAAAAQRKVNAPYHELLKIKKTFERRFMHKVGDNIEANDLKIRTFVKRADQFDEAGAGDKQLFEETIAAFGKFTEAAKGSYSAKELTEKFGGFARNTEAINKQWADFGELLAAQKELRHLSQTNDSSMSLLAGGAAYAIGGIPGAVVAAAANDIIRPGNAIRRRMVIHNMKSMMTKRIDKSVSRVTNRIIKNKAGGPQRASKVPSILALVGVKSTGDSNEDIAAEMQAIQQIASPDALAARIEQGTADLEDAPMLREELTNATIRQIGMLRDAAAKGAIVETDPLTGQQKIVMSDSGKGEYREVRDTLADPVGNSTQALENGTASRTMGRTFAQAFPILFQEYVEKLLGDIREEAEKTGIALAFADTMQLSSFTGIPLSPTLNPVFIGAMQNVMKATDQGRRPQRRVASLKESANRAILPVEQAMT